MLFLLFYNQILLGKYLITSHLNILQTEKLNVLVETGLHSKDREMYCVATVPPEASSSAFSQAFVISDFA